MSTGNVSTVAAAVASNRMKSCPHRQSDGVGKGCCLLCHGIAAVTNPPKATKFGVMMSLGDNSR